MVKQHRNKILRLATSLSSRQAAFLFALTGVIVQAFHTYYITNELSSLSGFWRVLQALLMAGFISCALLYFTLKSSDEDTKAAKRYRRTVWWFAIIETFINLYYWGNHLLIQKWPDPDYGSFLIALPFSFLIPFTLKVYAGEVRTDDYSDVEISPDEFEDTLYQTFGIKKPNTDTEPIQEVPSNYNASQADDLETLKQMMDDMPETPPDDYPVEPYPEDIYTNEDYPEEDYPEEEEQQLEHHEDNQQHSEDLDMLDESPEEPEEHVLVEPITFESNDTEESFVENAEEPVTEPTTTENPVPESTEDIKTFPIVEDNKEKESGLPELGKELLNTFANGGLNTTPAYVAPKGQTAAESYEATKPDEKKSEEDELFNYSK